MRPTVRWLGVADLVVFAVAWVYREPIPEGPVLLRLAKGHGVTVSDIPAVAALLLAAWLAAGAWTHRPSDARP